MSYHKITSFAVKDTMADNNPLKVVRGKEFDDEFDAITSAMDIQELVIANLVTTPPGGIIMYAAPIAPSGFLVCDGAARSRNTYTALFQAIGTTYGAGDGSTTFNVPNFNGRFPYGGSPGQLGGSADATLPLHTHGASTLISDPGHSHTYPLGTGYYNAAVGSDIPTNTSASRLIANNATASAGTGITAATNITAVGTIATNANLPPFVGVYFIIKT